MKQVQKVSLLNGFGEKPTVDYKVSQNASKFMQDFLLRWPGIENLVDYRVRLYKKMKTNSLPTLPSDPNSMEQAILHTSRIHYQLYYWLRFDTKEIDVINMEKLGWSVKRESGAVTSVWFKGIFFQSLLFY